MTDQLEKATITTEDEASLAQLVERYLRDLPDDYKLGEDYLLLKEFLLECPIRLGYLLWKRNDCYATHEIICDNCRLPQRFPYAIIYHCSDCDNNNYDSCSTCWSNTMAEHLGHQIVVDYQINIFGRFYAQLFT